MTLQTKFLIQQTSIILILHVINNYSMPMRANLSSSCPKSFVLYAHDLIYHVVVYCTPTAKYSPRLDIARVHFRRNVLYISYYL